MNIRTVTVVGASGTMGSNISAIFASFGNAKVYMIGRDIEKIKKIIPRAVKSVRADCIADNLIPADYSMLEECVSKSDLIFESVSENFQIKSEIAKRISDAMSDSAIACTGTSGLSITQLAECYSESNRSRFWGIHMYNPPYNMNLCEFISTKYSDISLQSEIKDYLKNILFRTVVEIKDLPAFLGNRIGFQFINEALQYAEKYKDNGGIDYIDAIFGSHTGRSMAPLVTSDFVGLDVHKAIVDNLYNNSNDYSHESFVFPVYAQNLVTNNKLGRKTGCGLYKTIRLDNNLKRHMVYDINTNTYRDVIKYVFMFADSMKVNIQNGDYDCAFRTLLSNKSLEASICLELLLKYILYSLYCTKNTAFSIHSADDVMVTGFNWFPPLAFIDAISDYVDIKELIKERLNRNYIEKIDLDKLFCNIEKSKYDYRPYFKSGLKK